MSEQPEYIEVSDLDFDKQNYNDLTRRDIRSLILHLLYMLHAHDYEISLTTVVDDIYNNFEFDIPKDSDAFLFTQDILKKREALDTKVEPYLKNWKIERIGICTLLILRMALWELENTTTIPNIIINEAIELAKCFSEKDAYKFVNGILDQMAKDIKKEKLVD